MSVQTSDLEMLKLARDSWAAGDHDVALERFEDATRANPQNLRAILERATALGRRYRVHEACNLLKSARLLAGDWPDGISKISEVYANIYRMGVAVECIESIPDASKTPDNWGRLAVYYELAGRFEEAEEAVNRCIDDAPDAPEPNLILARILSHQGELHRAYAVLEHLIRNLENPHPRLAIRAFYELAIVLDQTGDYENAVAAVFKAKEIQKRLPGVLRKMKEAVRHGADIGSVYRKLDQATIDRWLDCEMPPLPGNVRPAHLIGHPRSGTTLLEQVLDAHAEVITSSERMVFAEEVLPSLIENGGYGTTIASIDSVSTARLVELRRRYIDCLWSTHPRDFSRKVHIDKKPANTLLFHGLLRLIPESRFIVALRDPRDVVVSCFLRYFPLQEQSQSFCYLTLGGTVMSYVQIMEIWLYLRELLPGHSWLEVHYENTCVDTYTQASRVFRFLGLDDDAATDSYLAATQGKFVDSPTFADVRNPIHSRRIGRWENYAKYLEPHLEKLEPFVESLGYGPGRR